MAITIYRLEFPNREGPFTASENHGRLTQGFRCSLGATHQPADELIYGMGLSRPGRNRAISSIRRRHAKGWRYGWIDRHHLKRFLMPVGGASNVLTMGLRIAKIKVSCYNVLPDGQVLFKDPRS